MPITAQFLWRWRAIVDDANSFWLSRNVEPDRGEGGQRLISFTGSVVVVTAKAVAVFTLSSVDPANDGGTITTEVRTVNDLVRIEIHDQAPLTLRTAVAGRGPKASIELIFRDGFALRLPIDESGSGVDGLFATIGWR